jgi:membrane-bound lytic murein transglycosylase B
MTKGYLKMARALILAAAVSLAIACGPSTGIAQTPQPPTFASLRQPRLRRMARRFRPPGGPRGRDPAVLGRLLAGITPDDRVIELDQRQPEFVSPVWDYVTNRVTENRISSGRALKSEIGSTLDAMSKQRYGVPTGIILGIWGLESNYGEAALNWDVQTALATLAYEGRRREQFEGYLMALAEMVERGLASQGAAALVMGRRARPAAIHAGRLSHHRRRLGRRWSSRHLDQSRRRRRVHRQLSARSRLAPRRTCVRRSAPAE